MKYEWCKHLGFHIMMKEKCVESFPHICNFLSSQRQIFQKFLQNLEFLGIACHSLTTQPSSGEVVFIQPELSDVSDLTWIKCPWMKPSSEVPAISDCKLELSSSWGSFSIFRRLRLYPRLPYYYLWRSNSWIWHHTNALLNLVWVKLCLSVNGGLWTKISRLHLPGRTLTGS